MKKIPTPVLVWMVVLLGLLNFRINQEYREVTDSLHQTEKSVNQIEKDFPLDPGPIFLECGVVEPHQWWVNKNAKFLSTSLICPAPNRVPLKP